jgi:hypothetical protein
MINVFVINPENGSIVGASASANKRALAKLLSGAIVRTHRFPNGDALFEMRDPETARYFSVGGSSPIKGSAIVVGRRRGSGLVAPKCSLDILQRLVRFI